MKLILGSGLRVACIALQVVPGVGAIVAGSRNPHTTYLKHGIAQLALFLFGTWPLIFPGAAAVVWAWVDAYRMGRDAVPPGPWSTPTRDADPSTVRPTPADKRAARQARRAAQAATRARRRAERKAERDAAEPDDDTRFVP
jgi:hypothetical protein